MFPLNTLNLPQLSLFILTTTSLALWRRTIRLLSTRALVFSTSLFLTSITASQEQWQNLEADWLNEVFPRAISFSQKQGVPPVYLAFGANGEQDLLGYVFTTPDLPPEELGFSGPIDVLLGMDTQGVITGLKVLHYDESYKHVRGEFIQDEGFDTQFTNKPIADEFRLGIDIDGMSRATITSWAIARGIRNASRRVAMTYLPELNFVVEANTEIQALEDLQSQNWDDYLNSGFVREFSAPIEGESSLDFSIAYMGHYRLGELLVGANDYSNSDRTASEMIEDGHMLLIGLNGNTPRLQQLRLGAMQNGILYPNRGDRVVFAGSAEQGKIAERAQFAIAMYMHPDVDISQPFSIIYDTGEVRGEFTEYVGVEYQLPQEVIALVLGIQQIDDYSVIQILVYGVIGVLIFVLLVLNIPRIKQGLTRGKQTNH